MIIGSTYNLNNKVHNKPVILNNKPLSRTSTFECLGVLLDEKLKWDKYNNNNNNNNNDLLQHFHKVALHL